MTKSVYVPTRDEFSAAIKAYQVREPRGCVYFSASRHLSENWGKPEAMTAAIGMLLKSWHWAFYRFGMFDPNRLQDCLKDQMEALNLIRNRKIESFDTKDGDAIATLFSVFAAALRGGANRSQESPVAPAKALHLLAPHFLPLWDNDIAYHYGWPLMSSGPYVAFCWQMKELASAVRVYLQSPDDRTALKRVDEFNYSVYTKGWIRVSPQPSHGDEASSKSPT